MAKPFHVGPWLVQPRLCALSQGGESRRLTHKGMAVLQLLARAEGGVVTKEAMIDEVWEGAYTSDEALSAVIYEVRRALGDDARKPTFVETIRKSGYRLLAPVVWQEPVSQDAIPARPTAASPSWQRWLIAGGAAVVLLAAFFWIWRGAGVGEAREIRSVAVLPLIQVGAPDNTDALADGLTAMLVSDIAQVCPFEVVPGFSMRLDADRGNVWQVAEEMAVDAVLEGTVVHSGDRLWLSVQLVDTETGRLLWGGSYEREVGDALSTMRELAEEIAFEVNMNVADEAKIAPLR